MYWGCTGMHGFQSTTHGIYTVNSTSGILQWTIFPFFDHIGTVQSFFDLTMSDSREVDEGYGIYTLVNNMFA